MAIQTNKVEVDDHGLTYYAEPLEVRPILPIDTLYPVPQTVVTERKRHPAGVGAASALVVFLGTAGHRTFYSRCICARMV